MVRFMIEEKIGTKKENRAEAHEVLGYKATYSLTSELGYDRILIAQRVPLIDNTELQTNITPPVEPFQSY